MNNYWLVTAAAGAAIFLVSGFFIIYQLYKLVQTDAVCRGFKNPKLWGLLAVSGNNSSGLLLYLIRRRKYPVVSMTGEQKQFMDRCKRKIGVGLVFMMAGFIALVLTLFMFR